MSGKRAKAMRRQLRKFYQNDVTDFKEAVEALPLFERLKLALQIVFRCV